MSVAGADLRLSEMGPALIGAGADATVVIVACGDRPGISGVQNSTTVLLRGDKIPALSARFEFRAPLPIHLFARTDRGCLPLGTARCRSRPTYPKDFNHATLELGQPLSRDVLDVVRPVPAPGPLPGVGWVDFVDTDPIRALESFILGWFPEEQTEPTRESSTAESGDLPEALAAFHRLASRRPALYRFCDPVLQQPRRDSGPLGDRLVFAVSCQGSRDWSIPWPPEAADGSDSRVWLTEDPYFPDRETILEQEPLGRFLLQFTLYGAMNSALFGGRTYCMPAASFDALWPLLRPIPLSPFLPTYEAEKVFVSPGLLVRASAGDDEAVASFAALHRGTLTPLLDHGFRWAGFDG
jgi:hypothetical protein